MKSFSLSVLLSIAFVYGYSQATFLQAKKGHNYKGANYFNRINEFGYPNDYWKKGFQSPPNYYCEEIIQMSCGTFNCKAIGINGKFTSYYGDGQLESKGNYINTDKSKDVKWFQASGNFNSIKVGEWEFYDCLGKLIGKGQYKNDKMDGVWEINFRYSFRAPTGGKEYIIKSIVKFSNGIPNGEWLGAYPNGKPFLKCNFINGKKSGTSLVYYEEGAIKTKDEYLDSKLISRIEYDENGKVKK